MGAHRTRLAALLAVAPLAWAAAGAVGCSKATPKTEAEAARELEQQAHERAARDRQLDELAARINAFRDGWDRSYEATWRAVIERARTTGPSEFRGRTLGRAVLLGLLALLAGALVRIVRGIGWPAWVPWGRRQRAEASADPPEKVKKKRRKGASGVAPARATWRAVLGWIFLALRRAISRLLALAVGPRDDSDVWLREVVEARDAERHLKVADQALAQLPKDEAEGEAGDGRRAALTEAIGAWRGEVATVRRHLDEGGTAGLSGSSKHLLVALDDAQRRADTLRVELTRAALGDAPPDAAQWERWDALVHERAELPAVRPREIPAWWRLVAWGGLGGSVLAIFLLAGWAAAGALPLWLGVLVAVTSLVAALLARIQLQHRAQLSLLPGLADRLASRLLLTVAAATVLTMVSAMTTSESGLRLGEPPPLEAPTEVKVPEPPTALLPRARDAAAPASPGAEAAPPPPKAPAGEAAP